MKRLTRKLKSEEDEEQRHFDVDLHVTNCAFGHCEGMSSTSKSRDDMCGFYYLIKFITGAVIPGGLRHRHR